MQVKRIRRSNVMGLTSFLVLLIAIAFVAALCSGCAGTRGAGALGGGSHAAMFSVPANQQVAWKALVEVLNEDPTLFQVGEVSPPGVGTEGIVRGKKGSYYITIWVQAQGKDSTSFEVQAGLLAFTDGPTQYNLAQAIGNAVEKKLAATPQSPAQKLK